MPTPGAASAAATAVKREKGAGAPTAQRLPGRASGGSQSALMPQMATLASPAAVTQMLATTAAANSEARMREFNSLAQAAFAAMPQPPHRRASDGRRISAESWAQLDEATKAALRTRGRKLRRRRAKQEGRTAVQAASRGGRSTSSERSRRRGDPVFISVSVWMPERTPVSPCPDMIGGKPDTPLQTKSDQRKGS
jgi:hypothetical protein